MIEPTPVLDGEDAECLLEEVANQKYDLDKERFLDECRKVYDGCKIR